MLDLKRQFAPLRGRLAAVAAEIIDSGWYLLGERTREFEDAFATWVGVEHGAACANGTDAITLALLSLGIGEGDEVITVPNTAFPTACAIVRAGARPVFVDIDPDTWLMDPERVAAAVTPHTKAVVPVHLYGRMVDIPVLADAIPDGIAIVEDCAQAHGAVLRGTKAGGFGDLASFSFYPSKNLGALGDGGMVVTASADQDRLVRQLRFYGQEERDQHTHVGMNSRLDEIQAAFLSESLEYLDGWLARRREIASVYDESFISENCDLPVPIPESISAYHLYVLQVADRDGFRQHLADRGIQTGVHYPVPIHLQPVFADFGFNVGDLPVAEQLAGRIVSLPMAPHLDDDDVAHVVDACLDYLRRN